MPDLPENQPKVLIVEDDEHIAYVLKALLEREGFAVVHAVDGRHAELIIDNITPPDLVVLDSMLPYKSGLELLIQIRSHAQWSKVPVMMLSGKSQEQDIVAALDAGANDFVAKPFQPNELLARLRRLVRV